MKKILSFSLAVVMLLSLVLPPVNAQAAAAGNRAGVVSTSGANLNVRSGSSTGTSVIASLSKGSYITLIEKSGSWWKVEYAKGRYGYCYADYITPVAGNAASVATQSAALNVRSGAGTSHTRIGSLSKGESVVVLSSSGGWSRILYHGTKTGYVSAQYLSVAATGTSTVKLSVPSFKQTDSRWANVKIGTSGKTMAQIGCATTAIAMMESYRTGTTIYPDTMANRLSYTPGGSVYWPSHYTTVTSSAGYLTKIYNLLKQGKPVLFGAKNAYGGQHWVVITGFTGGDLTAGAFTIQDPGSSSRTTLQQFLSAYPNFYKYFHY